MNAWWVAGADAYENYNNFTGVNNEINRLAFRYNDSMNVVRFDGSAKNRRKAICSA